MSESPASYMIKVLSLSKLLNSDENLDPRYKAGNLISTYKCYSELTYPIAEMAVIKRSQFFESQAGLNSSPSIGIELVNLLLREPETLEELLVQIGSISNITKSLFEEISKIDKDKIDSPIAESYYTDAIVFSMTLARSSDVFFNAVIKSCLPPEEIKETLSTVITKPQSNEILNVSQSVVNNNSVKTANVEYDLGNICASAGQFEEALSQYNKAISIDKTNPIYYYNRASTLKKLGRVHDAITQYIEIIAKFPKYEKAYLSLASTYIETGNYRNSVDSYGYFIKANEINQPKFNSEVGGISQVVREQNELETIIKTSINYLSSEQQKLALQAFNEAYRETENNSKSSEYSYSSQNYQDSNTKNKSRNETDNLIKNEQLIKAIKKHFIYQSRKRLGILIFITSGLYMVYWYYKHWALFKEYQKDSKINLIICSIFSGISILGLARRIKKLSLEIETEEERETKKKSIPFYSSKPVNLLGFSFGAGSTWRFPFPFDLLGLFASIAIADIMYQGLLSCIEKYLDEKKKLSFLSGGFIGWTIFGIIMWSIYIIGSLPE